MSMEVYVFSDRRLDSMAEWQAALDDAGFNIRLDASRDFLDVAGFLPVTIDDRQSGFECDHFDAGKVLDELKAEGFPADRQWRWLLAFRFGGLRYECISALVSAALYMRATGGVLFDCEEGEYYGPDSALDYAEKASNPMGWDNLERLMQGMATKAPDQST
ncbi:hypothetical protein [Devosia chinhatensis]|uniref:Uncharacterized protein n=1 Tax=Devosia chinhatensis TaxID=429727 RepID=A0A0F5FF95_9HYPH|nr:hypothetical protein [Devosia chinhatensis]KKB07473.1 hypothetical protein VE26_11990 [Devosia chinhatensis]